MNIVIACNYYNAEKYGRVSEEFDNPETINSIKKVIEGLGHQVTLIEGDEDFYPRLKELKDKKVIDLVFNYSVGIYGVSRETHVPAMCEMLQIPYASSDVFATALCSDKAKAKDLLTYYGIKTPQHQLFKAGDEPLAIKLNFPVIVKYVYQGSSIGIDDDQGVVENEEQIHQRIKKLYQEIQQPIIVEEYILGREFTVGFYGNYPKITFFPFVELLPLENQNKERWIFNSWDQPTSNQVEVEELIKNKIYDICRKIIKEFDLRDWGRIDFRVKDDDPYVLEINNCAHLSTNSVYFDGAEALGLNYEQLITNMLNSALERYNLK
jgi:D-alanine-D-alanine ligase